MSKVVSFASLVLFSLVQSVSGEVRLPSIFSDHMVLQSDRVVPIWGWAGPGERVVVRIGGRIFETVADGNGEWSVSVGPFDGGTALTIQVEGENSVTVEEVIAGEVWLASGQSNMQFALSSTDTATEEMAVAESPSLRLFVVPRLSTLDRVQDVKGSWQVCSPRYAAGFSAVAYFFGRELQDTLDTPVGLIATSWGGTAAEEWTGVEWLDRSRELESMVPAWRERASDYLHLFEGPVEFLVDLDDLQILPKDESAEILLLDDFEDGDAVTSLFGSWSISPQGGHIRTGIRQSEAGYHLRKEGRYLVGSEPNLSVQYGSGRVVDLSDYKAVQFRTRGKGFIRFHSLQPDINDWDNYASGVIPLSEDWETVMVPFESLRQAGWGRAEPFNARELSGAVFAVSAVSGGISRPPGGLYNGMVLPIAPFGIRGAIWYQGESNAGRAREYRTLLPVLIKCWRETWQQGDFPFLIVQLPNFRSRKSEPSESDWAELREAQLLTAKSVVNTGMAVTIDLGEALDVHPRSKKRVGQRLAALALGTAYETSTVYSGPVFREMSRENKRLILEFANIGSGLVSAGGQSLKGFAVAGDDRVFVWAEAVIQGSSVVVWSDKVPNPVAVRYAWADNPVCNLYNREGFPASPFRSDDWPGITE